MNFDNLYNELINYIHKNSSARVMRIIHSLNVKLNESYEYVFSKNGNHLLYYIFGKDGRIYIGFKKKFFIILTTDKFQWSTSYGVNKELAEYMMFYKPLILYILTWTIEINDMEKNFLYDLYVRLYEEVVLDNMIYYYDFVLWNDKAKKNKKLLEKKLKKGEDDKYNLHELVKFLNIDFSFEPSFFQLKNAFENLQNTFIENGKKFTLFYQYNSCDCDDIVDTGEVVLYKKELNWFV